MNRQITYALFTILTTGIWKLLSYKFPEWIDWYHGLIASLIWWIVFSVSDAFMIQYLHKDVRKLTNVFLASTFLRLFVVAMFLVVIGLTGGKIWSGAGAIIFSYILFFATEVRFMLQHLRNAKQES